MAARSSKGKKSNTSSKLVATNSGLKNIDTNISSNKAFDQSRTMTEQQKSEQERIQIEATNTRFINETMTAKSTSNANLSKSVKQNTSSQKAKYIMDDGGTSKSIAENKKLVSADPDKDFLKSILHANHIFTSKEIDLYNKTYRFGIYNPHNTVTNAKEFVFFTKPDLSIIDRDDLTGTVGDKLSQGIMYKEFWKDLFVNRKRTIKLLQSSYSNTGDPFNHLLQNQLANNLDIPGLTSNDIETAVNMYGVGIVYRGSSEASDDGFDFSLEFKDTKWLDTYYFFKAYEEYETLKHHGIVRPWLGYIEDKIIHDQFAIYKFIVDEDMETILYYGKFYGVFPKSLPRDNFSSVNFDNGLSYSIDFHASFYEDLKPEIISDFNDLSREFYHKQKYEIDIYNAALGHSDGRAATAAYIEIDRTSTRAVASPNSYLLKLKWRGSDKV